MAKARGKNNRQQATKSGKQGSKNPTKSILKAGTSSRASKADTPGRRRNRANSSGGRRGNSKPRRNRSGSRNAGDREKKKPLTAEELDNAMDDYWIQNSNKEAAEKKLNEDMDAYWEKKEQNKEAGSEPAKSETENNEIGETKTSDVDGNVGAEPVSG